MRTIPVLYRSLFRKEMSSRALAQGVWLLIFAALAVSAFGQSNSTSPTPAASTTASVPADAKVPDVKEIAASKSAPVKIPMFSAAPTIDGQLNDAVWKDAAVFKDFLQTQPGDNIAPTAPTEVMMGYDARQLYIAFHIKQDRDKVRANVARRDNIFDDDYVGVYLDTFNDKRQAYCIFFNPLGIQADGTFSETNGENYSVDIVMESKGVLTPDGFTIEVSIPFKSLRYEAGKDKQWGIQLFRRMKYNNNELDSWMPVNRSISGSLNQAGHITGLEGIETARQLEINPSFTLSESGRRTRFTFDHDPAGRYVHDGLKGEFGMTAKLGLTPTITLDFAYNPDFAQVEADAPVSTANLRFPVFFEEKRPFFLERIDIFRSPLQVVNTRAIVDPDIAAKLTGRRGKNTFGIMYASDNAPGNFSKDERQSLFECLATDPDDPGRDCPNSRVVNKNADIGVLRFKRDVGKESNLGIVATTYNFVDYHNHAAGFDGRWRFDKKIVGEFQVMGSNTRGYFYDPNLEQVRYRTGNGLAYNFWIERSGRNLYMNYLAFGRSRDYRADVGFNERYDTNYAGSFIRYETDKNAKKAIIFKSINNATNVQYDWRGRAQYFIWNTRGMLGLQKQTYIAGNLQWGFERTYENEFGPNRTATQAGAFFGPRSERRAEFKAFQTFIESTPNKKLYLFFFLDYTAGAMDYDFGAGPLRDLGFGLGRPRASAAYVNFLNQRAGCQNGELPAEICNNLEVPALDPGPGNQVFIDSTIRYQPTTAFQTQLNYNKRRLVRHDTGLVAFDDNIFSSRSTYQFNRDIFARLRIDYSTLNRRIRSQLVWGWTPSPGTALYVGYNDDMNYNSFNPYNRVYEPGLHGNGRTFFIKMSYLFRKSF